MSNNAPGVQFFVPMRDCGFSSLRLSRGAPVSSILATGKDLARTLKLALDPAVYRHFAEETARLYEETRHGK